MSDHEREEADARKGAVAPAPVEAPAADGPNAPDLGRDITSWRVIAIAGPVALSNATVPIQGAVDTAVIGRLGLTAPLAAVGLGAEILNLVLGAFNFLQIGVSGMSAQALGARRHERLGYVLLRGLMLGGAIGLALFALQGPIIAGMLALFDASAETEALTATYISWRVLGAPAELMNYVLVGWFAGQEQTRRLVAHQVVLASLNIAFNVMLVVYGGLGVAGVAIGTAIASWLGLCFGLWLVRDRLRVILPERWRPRRETLFARSELIALLKLNRDIFIRTFLLVFAILWMARLGAQLGDETLAANVVLWQFFMFSAYGMDGFAIAAESLVGQSLGARDRRRLDRAVALTMFWGGVLGLWLSLLFTALGGSIIDLFTTSAEIRALARDYAGWATWIPIIGVWAFVADGVFVGATGSREMRDAMILSSIVYYPLSVQLMDAMGNDGIWLAVWIWLVLRALTLAAFYPRVRARAAA